MWWLKLTKMALFQSSWFIQRLRLCMCISSPAGISRCGFPHLRSMCVYPSVRSAVSRVPGLLLDVWNGKIRDVRSLSLGKAALKSATVYCCWSEHCQRVNINLSLLSVSYSGSSHFSFCHLPHKDWCRRLSVEENSAQGYERLECIEIFHGKKFTFIRHL